MDTIYTLFCNGSYLAAYRELAAAQAEAQRRAVYRGDLDEGEAVSWSEDAGRTTRWAMMLGNDWAGYHVTEDKLR